jgi:hypothetical protein
MNMLAWPLALVCLVQDATPAASSCGRADHRCRAAMFQQRAKAAKTAAIRGDYLEAAHGSFLALYKETDDADQLCAARHIFDQLVRVLGRSSSARARLKPLRRDLEQQEAQRRPNCGGGPSKSSKKKTLVSAAAQGKEPELPTKSEQAIAPTAVAAQEPDHTTALSARSQLAAVDAPHDVLMPVPRFARHKAQQPTGSMAPTTRPGRIVGGVVLMLASGALTTGMGLSLRARARVNGEIDALEAMILAERRMPTAAELLDVDQANDKYRDLTVAAAVTGVASLASLGISVALFATARRRGRVEAQPWAGTRSAGLSLVGRF